MDNYELIEAVIECGADKAAPIEPSKLYSSSSFRKFCEDNVCGSYGKCWSCPPDIGDIDVLRAELGNYEHIVMYQVMSEVKDYSDAEGLYAAGEKLSDISQKLLMFLRSKLKKPFLLLGGSCHLCRQCAKITNEPCRFPDKLIPSMSAYGIDVCKTCEGTPLDYMNGENIVTNFGMVLYND